MNSGCSAGTISGSQSTGCWSQYASRFTSRGSLAAALASRRYTTMRRTRSRPRTASSTMRFQVDRAAAPVRHVADDQHRRARVHDAIAQRRRAEAGVDHGVDRADARAREHRDDAFDRQGHVDAHAVARPHAVEAQRVRQLVHAREQRAVRERALLAVLAHIVVRDRAGSASRRAGRGTRPSRSARPSANQCCSSIVPVNTVDGSVAHAMRLARSRQKATGSRSDAATNAS